MSLVHSLLQAIVSVGGEALVMHAGEKPYVIAPAGQVELASRGLTVEALEGIVAQLLPSATLKTLDEVGAVQHVLAPRSEFPGERFTVVAARGGQDAWVEIRRRPAAGAAGQSVVTQAPPASEPAIRPAPAGDGVEVGRKRDDREARPFAPPSSRPLETVHAEDTPPAPEPPAVVVPISRNPVRSDTPPPIPPPAEPGLERLLRIAAARGASTLYLSSDARPSVRVDGELQVLEGEAPLEPHDVEALLLTVTPERNHEALRRGSPSEWLAEVPEVGPVRCMSFRDHRGPGGVFRLISAHAISAEQLGLPREVQSLVLEPEGLILVAGPRVSGKRTTISALVDLVNRTRRDHVITVESEINIPHARGTSLVSQREVHGGREPMVEAVRAALREDPDVLVVESLRTAGLVDVALEAATSGHLVIGGLPARSATAAVDRIIDSCPPERRLQVQLTLARRLLGVIAQVLLRRIGGGRLAAREILLNSPAVASALAEGQTSQLPMAMESGRRQGMMPLNHVLVGFVQAGAVDVREAYLRAADRAGFLALLKRSGLDTSALERPA
jgi:twitching motility protein PilT